MKTLHEKTISSLRNKITMMKSRFLTFNIIHNELKTDDLFLSLLKSDLYIDRIILRQEIELHKTVNEKFNFVDQNKYKQLETYFKFALTQKYEKM